LIAFTKGDNGPKDSTKITELFPRKKKEVSLPDEDELKSMDPLDTWKLY
jgi:hypothetical protein